MVLSDNINTYIKNSLINNRLCRFNKHDISVFISNITDAINIGEKNNYYNQVQKAMSIWNKYAPIRFYELNQPQNADIIVNWTKVGIKQEGSCKYRSIIANEIRAITIDIGLANKYSQKTINEMTILHTALHELGHSMGLGHGVEIDDLMYIPHKKTLNVPSENDLYVLKLLYYNNIGTTFEQLIR